MEGDSTNNTSELIQASYMRFFYFIISLIHFWTNYINIFKTRSITLIPTASGSRAFSVYTNTYIYVCRK